MEGQTVTSNRGRNSSRTPHEESECQQICRICRCQDENCEVIQCPCQCKGSIGHIHLNCLKRWILYSGEKSCEICRTAYQMPRERCNIKYMAKSLFSVKCAKPIARNMIQMMPLLPLGYNLFCQMLILADSIQAWDYQLLIAYFTILTTQRVLAAYFYYIAQRVGEIQSVLGHWWMFGNSSEFASIEY